MQIASAAVFGFSGWALVLPQALAGVGSVALVYAIVSRPFGKTAGLISALVLAITPIFVAVSRNGTMDGLLIFVLLLAVWFVLKAARENSLPLLLLAAALEGVGFNIKMIQAFIVVPAILAVYLLGAQDTPLKKRVVHLCLAGILLLGVSLFWAVAVDMIPADQRPYIGGSGDNTVLGLIVNYNGMHRLENGMMQPPDGGAGPQAPEGSPEFPANRTDEMPGDRFSRGGNMAPPDQDHAFPGNDGPSGSPGLLAWPGRGMSGGMMDDSGSPGIFRLLGDSLAGQISWLLLFTLFGTLAWLRRPADMSLESITGTGIFTEKGQILVAMGAWLLPGLLYFSFTTGFWHIYYLATIAPPLAALTGIGATGMYAAYRGEGILGWLLVAAVAATGLVQTLILMYTREWSGILVPLVLCGTIVTSILLAYFRICRISNPGRLPKILAGAAVALLLVAPFVWACTPLIYGGGGILPSAGPQLSRGGGIENAGTDQDQGDRLSRLAEYLVSHTTNETWIVAVPGSNNEGSELIIKTGKPVMSLGGFAGSDQILSVSRLTEFIREGKIRYFLVSSGGGGGMGFANSDLFTWVSDHCTTIPPSDWGDMDITSAGNRTLPAGRIPPGTGSAALYDCGAYAYQKTV